MYDLLHSIFEENFTSARGAECYYCEYGVTGSLSVESLLEWKCFHDTDGCVGIVAASWRNVKCRLLRRPLSFLLPAVV